MYSFCSIFLKYCWDDRRSPISDTSYIYSLQALHSPTRHQRQAEEAHGARIARLNQELALKTQTVQELTRTVERLQKERRNMLSGPILQPDSQTKEPKRQLNAVKSALSTQEEMFPAAQCEKTYQPTVFTGMRVRTCLSGACEKR